ncbi:MAG: RyR domain-containing protein [Rhodoplanes sp.]|jgi:RyR domain/TrkA-N domain|nr:RyR domain-containing protein [Rhodoplanes sp.]
MISRLAMIVEEFVRAFALRSARLGRLVGQRQRLIQIAAAAAAVTLGLWGWAINNPPANLGGWLDNIFRTAQLVTLQFPTDLGASIPWQLQIARLLMPLVAVFATINVLVGAITRPMRLALMPYAKGHVVVCGAAQLNEAALNTLVDRGRRIVTVAPAFDPARCEALDVLGITFIEADPFQSVTFRALNIAEASALFLTHEDDLANLDLAMLALAAVEKRPDNLPPLVLGIMIEREDLARELDAALDGLARKHNIRYHRLCPDREGLRIELRRVAPVFLKADPSAPSRLLVVGLDGNWQQIIMQLVVSSQDHPATLPLISLVLDEAEATAFAIWRSTKPDLDLVARFEVLPRGAGLLLTGETPSDGRVMYDAPQLVVVLRADADAVATALALRRPGNPFGLGAQPILVHRSKEDRLLARLGETEVRNRSFRGLVAFGGLVRPEAIERVLDRRGDETAIALHENYLDAANTLDAGSTAALAAWGDLPENLRDANRAAAEHAPILFASAGLRLVPTGEGAAHIVTAAELETLARVEHRRWMADRIDRGWRSGSARDDERLIHPKITPFERLSARDREKDRNTVRVLHAAIEHAGFRLASAARAMA